MFFSIININKVFSWEDKQKCLVIRKKVFVDNQNVPLTEDIDGKDDESQHYLMTLDSNIPVGVARVRYLENIAKIERVAILEDYQGHGLGKKLMHAILTDLRQDKKMIAVQLSAQCYTIPFYEKLGFNVCSEEYTDAGILHKDMVYEFSNLIL